MYTPVPLLQAGCLSRNLPKWREFTSDPWIPQTVSGYHLEFETTPHQVSLPKFPKFSERETVLIESEISNLVSKGAVTELSPCDNEFISTVFLVTKKTGDFRPVINLKPLNQFVEKIHFKMENIHMALNCISPGDFRVSIDLKDAYFNVPIFQPHRKFAPCKGIQIPESTNFSVLESGILGFRIRNPALRIWNPANDWNPESKLLKIHSRLN